MIGHMRTWGSGRVSNLFNVTQLALGPSLGWSHEPVIFLICFSQLPLGKVQPTSPFLLTCSHQIPVLPMTFISMWIPLISWHGLEVLLLFWSYFILFLHCLLLHFTQCLAPRKCSTNMSNERIKGVICKIQEGQYDFSVDASQFHARPACPPVLFTPLTLLATLALWTCYTLMHLRDSALTVLPARIISAPVGPSIWHPVGSLVTIWGAILQVRNDVLVRVVWTSPTNP